LLQQQVGALLLTGNSILQQTQHQLQLQHHNQIQTTTNAHKKKLPRSSATSTPTKTAFSAKKEIVTGIDNMMQKELDKHQERMNQEMNKAKKHTKEQALQGFMNHAKIDQAGLVKVIREKMSQEEGEK